MKKKLFFVFDECNEAYNFLNLTNCRDLNNSNLHRIGVSPVTTTIIRKSRHDDIKFKDSILYDTQPPQDKKYIISVGVGHAPWQWCGPDSKGLGLFQETVNVKNIFHYLKDWQLKDLRDGKAYFLIDQTHEGYHADWLWDWFYNSCDDYSISPKQIIYFTGDMNTNVNYQEWAKSKGVEPLMCVVPVPHFEDTIYNVSTGYTEFGIPHPGKIVMRKLPNYEHHISYKKSNFAGISPFNILQKRPRGHRLWFYKYLYDANLINGNIVSMNKFNWSETYTEGRTMDQAECENINRTLPLMPFENPENYTLDNFSSHDGGQYIIKINDVTMLKSWMSIISEASCSDHEHNCFISEKTFKPIACQHPFIILGSKGVLKNLQSLGYKTFSPYINESYDDLSTFERMEAIVEEMKKFQNMNAVQWLDFYSNVEGILKYNFRHFSNRAKSYVSRIHKILTDHIGE